MTGYRTTQEYVARGGTGIHKLTEDFEVEAYSGDFVRDINFTPSDKRMPDMAICRIYSTRADAEVILTALLSHQNT